MLYLNVVNRCRLILTVFDFVQQLKAVADYT